MEEATTIWRRRRRRGSEGGGRRMWAMVVVLLVATTMIQRRQGGGGWGGARAETNPGDMAILKEFKSGMKNGELLGWSGDDACGGNWPHIQCQGAFILGIQVANLGLQGTLPSSLNQLPALAYLGLQRNSFTGPLPSLHGLRNLRTAYLNDNQFDSIPLDFFSGLPNLTSIFLDNNRLNSSGWSIPPDINSSSLLQTLSLTNVSLAGPIPDFLGSMQSLRVLHLAYNKLSGSIPASFRWSNLRVLQLNNQMGPVLTGRIDVVGIMLSLTQLWLQVNKFSGPIPEGLTNAASLTDIRLNDNRLVGPIPWGLKDLFLADFTVQNNRLNGPIPPIRTQGGDYNVANNPFCQSKPGVACSPAVTALLKFLGAVNYPSNIVMSWGGNDPCAGQWVGVTCSGGNATVLNLAYSQLSGIISPYLSQLTTLTVIKLNGNNFTGTIPASLTTLRFLKVLDVSNNQLIGPVPNFPKQVRLSIGGNPLANSPAPSTSIAPAPTVPTAPAPISSSSAPLPGAPRTPSNTTQPPKAGSNINPPTVSAGKGNSSGTNSTATGLATKSSSISVGTIVGPVLGVVVLLVLAPLVVLLLVKKRRKKFLQVQSPNTVVVHPRDSSSDPDTVKIVVAGQNGSTSDTQSRNSSGPSEIQVIEAGNLVISVQVLRNVTNNFSEENILGRGGFGVVYKGELDDGTKIAVKRMEAAVVSNKGLNEFQAEIAVLTKVRHRHLVTLLGYCINGNERLLVYEYMPQGPLSRHLFDWVKHDMKPLDWKRRLIIALDVARGMEYLHGLAHKSFIHRDLKPSNILLGDDYRAKVSDFGLVKLAPEGKYSVETRLAGTFGYLAPEYAVTGRVTTKSDVFSFGVVLMELLTGRRALDESQPEDSMHLVAWFRRLNVTKESFRLAVDAALEITEESFHSICTVAELAGHCTAREPSQRPDMGHAVNVLAPLVERWKPTDIDSDESGGIDLEMTLPQALKKWQAYEEYSSVSSSNHGLDDSAGSLPIRPTGFAESFTSADAR